MAWWSPAGIQDLGMGSALSAAENEDRAAMGRGRLVNPCLDPYPAGRSEGQTWPRTRHEPTEAAPNGTPALSDLSYMPDQTLSKEPEPRGWKVEKS